LTEKKEAMITFDKTVTVDAPLSDAFTWHMHTAALERLLPPWLPVRMVRHEGIRDGARAVLDIGPKPLSFEYVAEHRNFRQNDSFEDVQVKGPFRSWRHVHSFTEIGGACTLGDHIRLDLPFGLSGWPWLVRRVSRELERQFAYRHRVLSADLGYLFKGKIRKEEKLTIGITGSSGLIGTSLRVFLEASGHTVLRIRRTRSGPPGEAWWDPETGTLSPRLNGIDAIVHLAGETLFAPRWTTAKKERIYKSRVDATRGLARSILELTEPPPVFLGASAIGIYGSRGSETLTENSEPGDSSFLVRVCIDWEQATRPLADAGIRVANARFGLVLTPAGGALQKMLPAFRLALGGSVGDGRAYLSWITPDDMMRALDHIIRTPDVSGPVNITSPNPVRWDDYAAALGRVLRRPAVFRIPAGLIEGVAGDLGREMLLASARVLPSRLEQSGFRFRYSDIEEALRHVLGRELSISTDNPIPG
jgi:uncharacterized protein (TIGR01777 family)